MFDEKVKDLDENDNDENIDEIKVDEDILTPAIE